MTFTCCKCKKDIVYNCPTVGSYNVGDARDATGAMPIMVSIPDCLTLWACKDCSIEIQRLAEMLAEMVGNMSAAIGACCTRAKVNAWLDKFC